jgi:hypothetical protein
MHPARELIRHTLATIAYRADKALREPPAGFASCRAAETSRSAGQILAHLGDLFDWALSLAKGQEVWHAAEPLPWEQEVKRFFASLAAFDAYLAADTVLGAPPAKLLQGPIADALTHVGQIAMLRRVAGAPVKGENYFRAEISIGQCGPSRGGA